MWQAALAFILVLALGLGFMAGAHRMNEEQDQGEDE